METKSLVASISRQITLQLWACGEARGSPCGLALMLSATDCDCLLSPSNDFILVDCFNSVSARANSVDEQILIACHSRWYSQWTHTVTISVVRHAELDVQGVLPIHVFPARLRSGAMQRFGLRRCGYWPAGTLATGSQPAPLTLTVVRQQADRESAEGTPPRVAKQPAGRPELQGKK